MPGIDSIFSVLDQLDGTNLSIHQERCVCVRNRHASCRRCAQACPTGTIKLDGNQLLINAADCIGCATCASVCPTAAIEATNPTDDQLLNLSASFIQEQKIQPVFACAQLLEKHKHTYDKERIIGVICLSRLEESQLLALNTLGATDIQLLHDNCASCPSKIGQQTIELIHHNLNTILDAWQLGNVVMLHQGLPEELMVERRVAKKQDSATGVSRRDFFKQIKEEATSVAANAAAGTLAMQARASSQVDFNKVLMRGELSHFTPPRHDRLLTGLAALEKLMPAQTSGIETRLFGRVRIDAQKCNSCMICARFCPTGALSTFEQDDDSVNLVHYPAYCVQCNLCSDTCMRDAVEVLAAVDLQEVIKEEIIQHILSPYEPLYAKNELPMVSAMRNLLGDTNIYEHG